MLEKEILFIIPPRRWRSENVWKKIDRCLPSLGIGYLASYLEQNNIPSEIMDLQIESCNLPDVYKRIRRVKPRYIGFTATTVQINSAFYLAKNIKEEFKNLSIIFGGPHPSVMPEESLLNDFVDLVVRGEGEETVLEIVKNKEKESILGLSFKKNGNIIHNSDRGPIGDLDRIPFPAYHLFPLERYRPSSGNYLRLPAMSMITTRGCPGKCTFCDTSVMGHRVRGRSGRNIADEVVLLRNKYGIKEISFYDDTITAQRNRIIDFCRIVQDEKIDITWSCMSRADFMDRELLRAMRGAGCHQIGYGIESASEIILENINKKISLDKVREVVKLTKETGIDVRAMFMFGSPGETKDTLGKTLDFALELDPDIFVFNITTPYPGTEMFSWAKEKNILRTLDWDRYDLSEMVIDLESISAEDTKHFYKKAYIKAYFRLSYFIKRLFKIKSFPILKRDLKVLFSMLKDLFC